MGQACVVIHPQDNGRMSANPDGVNKVLVGVLAVVCLLAAGVVAIFFPDQQAVLAAFTRVGIVMAALWAALPKPGQQVRLARMAPALALCVVLVVATRKAILAIIPLLAVVAVLSLMLRPVSKGPHPPRRF